MNLPAATANRDAAMVIFCRRPRPGVGKQRLAATLGADRRGLCDRRGARVLLRHHRCFSCFKYDASCSETKGH